MDAQDMQALERVVENRKARDAADSSCASPPMKHSSFLCAKILSFFRKNRTSPPEPSELRGCGFPTRGRSRGLPPSPSANSNKYMPGGVPGLVSANCRGIGRTNVAAMGSPMAASTRPKSGRGRGRGSSRHHDFPAGHQRELGQGGVQPITTSSRQSSPQALGHENIGAASASAPIAKGRRKRKRLSKKAPIVIFKATKEEFMDFVQRHTACREPPVPVVVRPQPERPQPEHPQANAVPINVGLDSCEDPPARADSSPTSMISVVHSPPSPIVSDRVSEAPFCVPSTSVSSSLNDVMGFGSNTPRFLEDSFYDENLGQLSDDSLQPASSVADYPTSEPMKHKREGSTTPANPVTVSVQEDAVLPSEGNGGEGIPREQVCSGTYFDSGSQLLGLGHRHHEMGLFEMEYDPDEYLTDDRCIQMADSFLNFQ